MLWGVPLIFEITKSYFFVLFRCWFVYIFFVWKYGRCLPSTFQGFWRLKNWNTRPPKKHPLWYQAMKHVYSSNYFWTTPQFLSKITGYRKYTHMCVDSSPLPIIPWKPSKHAQNKFRQTFKKKHPQPPHPKNTQPIYYIDINIYIIIIIILNIIYINVYIHAQLVKSFIFQSSKSLLRSESWKPPSRYLETTNG